METKSQAETKLSSLFNHPENKSNFELFCKYLSQPLRGIVVCQVSEGERLKIFRFFNDDPLRERIHIIDMIQPLNNPMDLQESIIHAHEEFGLKKNIFFIYNLEDCINLFKISEIDFFQKMNLIRDFFMRFDTLFVFFMEDDTLKQVIRHAVDFYDWIMNIFIFVQETGFQFEPFLEIKDRDEIKYSQPYKRMLFLKKAIETGVNEREKTINLNELALLYKQTGDNDKALQLLLEGLKTIEKSTDSPIISGYYKDIGDIYAEKGDYDPALKFFQDALKLFKQTNDRRNQAYVYFKMGDLGSAKQDYPEAKSKYREALNIYTELNDIYEQARTYHRMGVAAQNAQDLSEAAYHFHEASKLKKEFEEQSSQVSSIGSEKITERKKTDFFITYHHNDEMAARWIASVLKNERFTTLSDSWDFLPGETPLEKIDYTLSLCRIVVVLISEKFLQTYFDIKNKLNKSVGRGVHPWRSKNLALREGFSRNGFLVRIDSCEIEKALGVGDGDYLDLAGIKETEAVNRLLEAVGATGAVKKETEFLPVSAKTPDEILEKRKQKLGQLLNSTIKHNYHMKLDLEQEIEIEVEVEDGKTGKKEKRKQWVWEPVPLETVLKDRKNYLLVNPSGMGKTTFLTYAAWALLDRDAHYPFLPLFLMCIALNNRPGTIESFIRHQVEPFYTHSQGSLISAEWENLCILIDALDQARDVDDIVSSLLPQNKYGNYKKAKIILSSRESTADRIKEGFNKIRLRLPVDDEVQYYLGDEFYILLESLIHSSRDLVTIPVLLEMLKTITEKGNIISTLYNRAGLYTEFTKILLDQERSKPRFWQDRLSIRHFIDYELEQALEKIAFFSLMDNEILEIPKAKLAKYCESPEKKEALLNIGIVLEIFEDREQKIVFRDQSFQGYFAARYIYYRQPELFKHLTGNIGFFYNDVWYEVMRFFVGLEKDPQKAGVNIEAIYKTNEKKGGLQSVLRLIFAVFLMSEARVSIEITQEIYIQLKNLFTGNKGYLVFFFSNIDKFNKSNDQQWRSLLIIIELLLRDKNADVRSTAAEALGNIGTTEHIPLLEPLLRDKNADVRKAAVETFGNIGSPGHVFLLEPLLRDKNADVRSTAAEALGNIGTTGQIAFLAPLLKDKNADVRSTAAEALGNIGTTGHIPLLEPLLRDKNADVRSAAVESLGSIGTTEHIPLLEPLLRDNNADVRGIAAEVLGNIGNTGHIALLEPLLRDNNADVRSIAAEALGNIVIEKNILLEPFIMHKDRNFRTAAAVVLGNIGTIKDIPLLETLLRDKSKYVQIEAVRALGKIGSVKDIPLLEQLFRDKNDWIRNAAGEVLGEIGTSKDIIYLVPLLRDKNNWVRSTAIYTLGKIGTSKHIHFLKPLLKDEYKDVRIVAAGALGDIGTTKYIPLLVPLLRDKDLWVRDAAADAIESIYKRSTPKLSIGMILQGKKEKAVFPVDTFSSQSLHILHISDIYYTTEKDPAITLIFHEFLQDIKKWRMQQNNTAIHSICITGDIAQSGQENQYLSIQEKINAVLNTTGCPTENLFIIPGNHDVQDFHIISDQGKTLLEQVKENKIDIDSDVLGDFEKYREFYDKFANYYRFIENSRYEGSLPETRDNTPKPWYKRGLNDFPVSIIGLNSALFCIKGFNKYGTIRMGTSQFQDAYFHRKASDIRIHELVILLTHHPLNWLEEKEYDEFSTLLERCSVIHLHSNVHKTGIERKQKLFSNSGGYVSIGTGSLYGEKGKEDINTYHIITLDFEKDELFVWARRWNPDSGKWTVYDDDGNNRFPLPVKK